MKCRAAYALASLLTAGIVLAADEPPSEPQDTAATDASSPASAESAGAATPEFSIPAPLAGKSLLLDAARAGSRMVVVGERGHILTSDDQGRTWKQSKVPTRASLTGVFFLNDKLGWAVGHDEVILRTEDGGATWEFTHSAPEKQQPLLDVWFKDANTGLAIGAYGTMLESSDGGRTWRPRTFDPRPLEPAAPKKKVAAPDEQGAEYAGSTAASDVHLNAIVRAPDGKLYIAGEAGNLFRSDDDGQTWLTLPSPYEGSFFGILPLSDSSLLAFGLRGHLYRSDDHGRTWRKIETGTEAMLTDAAKIDAAHVVMSGLAGTLLVSSDGGETFKLLQQPDRKGNSSVLPVDAARFVVAGEGGVRTVTP